MYTEERKSFNETVRKRLTGYMYSEKQGLEQRMRWEMMEEHS